MDCAQRDQIFHCEGDIGATRILVVDDDQPLLRVLELAGKSHGFNIVAVHGGEEALEAYTIAKHAGTPFDIIVTDLGMPFLNGMELEERIRAVDDDYTVFIFLTGSDMILSEDAVCKTESDELYRLVSSRAALKRAPPVWRKPMSAAQFAERLCDAVTNIETLRAAIRQTGD